MAATVLVRVCNGAGPTYTDFTGLNSRYTTDDTPTSAGTTNPVPRGGGTNYSYWRAMRLDATVTPVTSLTNLKVYVSNTLSLPTGVTFAAQNGTAYTQASGTPGTTGLQLTTGNVASLSAATVDPTTWTSGSPKSLSGTLNNPSTGAFGDFVYSQVAVASTLTATATITGPVWVFLFDES